MTATALDVDACQGGCSTAAAGCRAMWDRQAKCCPDCTHGWLEPPGQLELWRPPPGVDAAWWVIVLPDGSRSPRYRILGFAAAVAASAATNVGSVWILAADHSIAQVYRSGLDALTIRPSIGWATAASRLIQRTTP